MNERCIPVDELVGVANLAGGDSRRTHLQSCPRCRARLAAYREFMEPSEKPKDTLTADANRRLSAALQSVILEGGEDVQGAEGLGPVKRQRDGFIKHVVRLLCAPGLRPIWGAAAVLALVLAINQVRHSPNVDGATSTLRGDSSVSGPVVVSAEPALLDDGQIHITWEPVADAVSYKIVFFAPDLTQLAQLNAGPTRSVTFRTEDIPGLQALEDRILYRIQALRRGESVAQSRLHRLAVSR